MLYNGWYPDHHVNYQTSKLFASSSSVHYLRIHEKSFFFNFKNSENEFVPVKLRKNKITSTFLKN